MPQFNPDVRNPSYERTKRFRSNPPVWAKWEYEPIEWAAFNAWDLQQAKREAGRAFRPYGILALIGLLAAAGSASYTHDLGWLVLGLGPLWLFGFGGLLNWWSRYVPAARLHFARQQGNRVVIITPISVNQAGISTPLVDRQLVLRQVWVTEGESLVLHFRRTFYRRGAAHSEIRVPIPRGSATEARQLAAQFQDQVV